MFVLQFFLLKFCLFCLGDIIVKQAQKRPFPHFLTGGTVDIDESELDVDEGVELVDSTGLPIREKMVYMSVGDAHETQDDISECFHI